MLPSLILVCTLLAASPDLTGRVVDTSGAPIAGARVFFEPGLTGALQETQSDAEGRFNFETLPPGSVGVFAHAAGFAFGGQHLNVSPGAPLPEVVIQLAPPVQVSGKVVDARGKPITGARITRIALQEQKVGIPLAKLKSLGFDEPASAADGSFAVGNVPKDGTIALKAGHPLYAQEALAGIEAGANNVKLMMYEGVLLEGFVVTRGDEAPVARAAVVITSAQPPQDSAIAFTDGQGKFSLRMKPGNYLYQATAPGWQSPGWIQFAVSGNGPLARTRIAVARTGFIRGALKDAKTSAPIAGARLSLESNGNAAAVVRTAKDGTYTIEAVEGENVLRLESVPGYMPPASGPLILQVSEGETKTLPDFWLAPMQAWRVQIVDTQNQPAPGVLVSLLRPSQLGWRVTGEDGGLTVDVNNFPADGMIVGMAESATAPLGALFRLDVSNMEGARVQLLPLATLQARVTDGRAKGLEGIVTGSIFPGERPEDELLLWRTVSGEGGQVKWNSLVPGLPQVLVALAGNGTVQSAAFNAAPGKIVDVAPLVVEGGKSTVPSPTRVSWSTLPVLCGTAPAEEEVKARPALVMYCDAGEAEALIAALSLPVFQNLARQHALLVAVVVNGAVSCAAPPFPVLRGQAPGVASTYLLRDGDVLLQTFGMPPLRALQGL